MAELLQEQLCLALLARPGQIPATVWILGFVSLLMDVSSEMVQTLLPLYMVSGLGLSAVTIGLIEAIVDDRVRADGMDLNRASTALRDQVHELSILFPSLGLSFGYIGNCDLGCGPRYDDRSWKVFTKLATGASTCSDVSWGGYPSQQLGRMAVEAEKALEKWCHATEKRLEDGEIRSLVRIAA